MIANQTFVNFLSKGKSEKDITVNIKIDKKIKMNKITSTPRKRKSKNFLIESDSDITKNKTKRRKKIKKAFREIENFFEASTVILRIEDGTNTYDIKREFSTPITFNKNKSGGKIQYEKDKWGTIISEITEEKFLTYIVCPICVENEEE